MCNRIQSFLVAATLGLASLLVTGCLDGSENIRIEGDGSGTASLTYLVPAAAVIATGGSEDLQRKILNWLDGDDRLHIDKLELANQEDRARIHIELSFDSALALVDLTAKPELDELPAAVRELVGSVDFRRTGRNFEIVRSVDPRAALGASLLLIPRSELSKHRLFYRISLPTEPEAHNAPATLDDGRTLKWDYSLADAIDTAPEMRIAGKAPLPWWLWVAGAALTACIALAIGLLLRRWRSQAGR